jgi:hypothetical protein
MPAYIVLSQKHIAFAQTVVEQNFIFVNGGVA